METYYKHKFKITSWEREGGKGGAKKMKLPAGLDAQYYPVI